jgi:ABC-type antimicrobial peptide transport system permease subunit
VLYTPYVQEREAWMRANMSVVIRSGGTPADLIGGARDAVRRADPRILVGSVQTLSALLDGQIRAPRFRATLIFVFAGLAVLLAAVGLGGVVAYAVSRRTPEIGLRLALGARRVEVLGMMLRQTAFLTVAGVGIGLVGALVSGRILSGFLFEVAPRDPLVLGGAAAVLVAVGLLAGWIPARGAARVEPLRALGGP